MEVVASNVEKPPVVRPAARDRANRSPRPSVPAIGRFTHWWATANMSTPIKVVLIVGAILLLILNSEWLVPVAICLGSGLPGLLRCPSDCGQFHRSASQPSATATAHVPRAPIATGRRRRGGGRTRLPGASGHARRSARKPGGQRMTELTGSFLMAAIVCAVLSLIILVAGGHNLDSSVQTWTFYAWLTVTSVAASWLMLGLAKFWEGTEGDEVLRRFVMMVTGLAIGVAAFAACDMLMIRLSTAEMFNVLELPRETIPSGMYAADGTPGLTAFLAFFATLFVVLAVVAASRPAAEDPLQPVCHDRLRARGHADSLADSVGVPAGRHNFRVHSAFCSLDELRGSDSYSSRSPRKRSVMERSKSMLHDHAFHTCGCAWIGDHRQRHWG